MSASTGRILHIVSDFRYDNGMCRVARLFAKESRGDAKVITAREFLSTPLHVYTADIRPAQIWVHGCWLPIYWKCCWKALRMKREIVRRPTAFSTDSLSLIRMTHGSLSPVCLKCQGKWKKRLAGPIEKCFLRHADALVATCPAEARWIRDYVGKKCPKIEVSDLKRFWPLGRQADSFRSSPSPSTFTPLHVLYLGRRHPLKGVECLERAIRELNRHSSTSTKDFALRIVSDHTGARLERDWAWCDVLCLPTLSENFGLVIAEALARGKRVITTDGAPAWDPGVETKAEGGGAQRPEGKLIYLRGYRDGTDDRRVSLLTDALKRCQATVAIFA